MKARAKTGKSPRQKQRKKNQKTSNRPANGRHRKTDGLTIASRRTSKRRNPEMSSSRPTATTSGARMRPQRPADANATARAPINTREIGKMKRHTQNSRNKGNPDRKISPLWARKTPNNDPQRAPRDNGTANRANTKRITTEISSGTRIGDRMGHVPVTMCAKITNDGTSRTPIKELAPPTSTTITVGVRTISEITRGTTKITIARDPAGKTQ